RFFRKKGDTQAAEPSLGERILAHESEPQTPSPRAHEDLLAAAERVRQRRTPQGELLPEYTGLTAGEVLERLAEEEHAAPAVAPPPVRVPKPPRRAPSARPSAAKPNLPAAPPKELRMPPPAPASKAGQTGEAPAEENAPHFEVRV
ncbi:MAG: hypothetical protein HXO81_03780, partial [Selenomonas sp.]|nr:hypothetical protein [Selenomonas sp.]